MLLICTETSSRGVPVVSAIHSRAINSALRPISLGHKFVELRNANHPPAAVAFDFDPVFSRSSPLLRLLGQSFGLFNRVVDLADNAGAYWRGARPRLQPRPQRV